MGGAGGHASQYGYRDVCLDLDEPLGKCVPRRTAFAGAALLGGLLATLGSARGAPDAQHFTQIERGRYLTVASDCAACHNDPDGDTPFSGGRPIPTPFGAILAPNITPDPDTGIGNLSEAQFDAVLREGKLSDGKREYPAMPYPYYAKLSREDVLAIRTYLNTVPPVRHAVVTNNLRFPFNMRSLMGFWNAFYFTAGEFQPDSSHSSAWNRGAYLVEGPGHCGACHTPKTLLGGDRPQLELQGLALQGWFAPNITNDERSGLGRWSLGDIVDYLKRGHNRFAAASGPMAEEVAHSSSRMTNVDLMAIAGYLKAKPGQSDDHQPLAPTDPHMAAGAAIYGDLCSACHKADGLGVPYLFPNIATSASVASREPTTLIRVILEGAQSVATDEEPTSPAMPAFGWQLTDGQVAAVSTYIRNSWGHAASVVTERNVRSAREALGADNR